MTRLLPLGAFFTLLAFAASALPLHTTAQGYPTQTIEVSEGGFNPSVCQMNRDNIEFKNVGVTPIRVILPHPIPGQDPLFDTGYLEPGETSNRYSIQTPGQLRFYNADNMSQFVTARTPVLVEQWEVICTPDPAFSPPPPLCRANPYCLRVPIVALDG